MDKGPYIEDRLRPLTEYYRSLPLNLRKIIGVGYRILPANLRFGPTYGKTTNLLRKSNDYSVEKLNELQLQLLQKLITHAYENVPYYHNLFDRNELNPSDISSLFDLRKIPCLTKGQVRNNKKDLIATNIPTSQHLYMNTGGSTGIPLELLYEKGYSRAREWAFMYNLWRRVGWKDGDSRVMLRGWSIPDGSLWQYEPIRNRLIMSAYHLSSDNLPIYLQKIRDFSPKFIEAYPSNLMIIANYMVKNNLPPIRSVKAILSGSENLFPIQRQLFEKAFDCRVFSWYGHGEIVALGGECEFSHDLHFFPEYGILELLSENDEAVTKDGEMGEIVATGFNNNVMPLIRYRTGDLGVLATGTCKCGRNYPRLKRIEGRKQELIVSKDGTLITLTGLIFGQHFNAFSRIERMQLIQSKVGELLIRIVTNPDYSHITDEDEIRQKIFKAVGDSLSLQFDYVEEISRPASGKHLFLIQELSIADYLI